MNAIVDRYRCPENSITACTLFHWSAAGGGDDAELPLDPTQVIENLRLERYVETSYGRSAGRAGALSRRVYYNLVRPFISAPLRRQLQRIHLRNWEKIVFPRWPLDVTVESLLEGTLLTLMKAGGIDAVPFIWFWPDGAPSAAIVTHDVETSSGREFCGQLMDIDAAYSVPSAFQIVPETRYSIPPGFLDGIRRCGHEINIHDLNHDGRLFASHHQFLSRVKIINQYGREFGAAGFRAAMLYRNIEWFHQLEFEYDMSVPNVGHLEAQRGGCCTVFPYFIDNILELPLTTTQDYSLFHMLRTYSLDLWKTQAAGIMAKHGLMSFITHPDYLQDTRAQETYRGLLSFLSDCRTEQGTWITTPGEVNRWWRERSQTTLVSHNGRWWIEGPAKDRAQVAYAVANGDQLIYVRDGSNEAKPFSATSATFSCTKLHP